jgi:hypothetical protein
MGTLKIENLDFALLEKQGLIFARSMLKTDQVKMIALPSTKEVEALSAIVNMLGYHSDERF